MASGFGVSIGSAGVSGAGGLGRGATAHPRSRALWGLGAQATTGVLGWARPGVHPAHCSHRLSPTSSRRARGRVQPLPLPSLTPQRGFLLGRHVGTHMPVSPGPPTQEGAKASRSGQFQASRVPVRRSGAPVPPARLSPCTLLPPPAPLCSCQSALWTGRGFLERQTSSRARSPPPLPGPACSLSSAQRQRDPSKLSP